MTDTPPYHGTPLWVKMLGAIGTVLVLLGITSFLIGHGPPSTTLADWNEVEV